jgi:hypothetical protein
VPLSGPLPVRPRTQEVPAVACEVDEDGDLPYGSSRGSVTNATPASHIRS